MKLLVVDGNSIINRAYYGIKALTTKNGEFTNAIYGFLSMLRSLLDTVQPDSVAVAFDLREPTFRHKMYDGYKAQRKGMPEELASQLQPVKDILAALGYPIVTCPGYEADDILGTLARACTEQGAQCVLATGDRDSLQLVGDGVTVSLATTQRGASLAAAYDVQAVTDKYGVPPQLLVDVKALMGDPSDNIPGVFGIGEKTASGLIAKYGSLDEVYNHLEELAPKVREKLEKDKEMAYLSRDLARIDREAPVDTDLSHYRPAPVRETEAAALFARYELFSIQQKWGVDTAMAASFEVEAGPAEEPLRVLDSGDGIDSLLQGGCICYIAWEADKPAAVALLTGEGVLFLDAGEAMAGLLEHSEKLRLWDSKPFYKYAMRQGTDKVPLAAFDGKLAAYLLSPNSSTYDIGELAANYRVVPRLWEKEPPEAWSAYMPELAVLGGLMEKLQAEVESRGETGLLYEIEMPLARVLAAMELEGFELDREALTAYGVELDGRLEQIQKGIYEQAGKTFNINSPKQLGVILFDDLGLPAKKKTKTGYSTNADVLESLRGVHPIINLIFDYRQLAKLKSTYVEGLLKVVDQDGRVRTTFQQTETRTGRISSTEPNMQNIPIRTEEGSRLRQFFRARQGWKLIDADYSQIELRVLAHIAHDEAMQQAFRDGEDIHRATAAQVFRLPPEMVTPVMRSRAKAVNFGIVYGIGAFSLSQDIGVSIAEAKEYIEGYLSTYSGVKRYMEEIIKFGQENGYVKTLFGRRRYLPELAASNKVTRAFGERVAMNTPIQGTAADIIKIAMVRVYGRLQEEGLRARLILQVHDELLVEAPEEEAARAAVILQEEMEGAMKLEVPLEAETNLGQTWLEAK